MNKLSFISSVLLLFTLITSSQTPQKVINLNTDESGASKDYVARDSVILSPGFSFAATSGNTFNARIDRSMIVNTEYLQGQSIPDPDNRTLNTSLQVGSTGGVYNVTPLGGLAYSIPLFCPPGTNGVQPALSIEYNSQSGNGLLGMGANLSGLSSIIRSTKPYYVDGNITAVNMNGNDVFAMDGNRMVLTSNATGYDGDVYKTEIETFSEITSKGASGNGPSWFEVKLRNGSVIQYGNGPNSTVMSENGTILAWNITRLTDPFGNYCEYLYQSIPVAVLTNQNYLERIRYTGNTNTNLQPYNEIHFYYESRSDKNQLYFPRLSMPMNLILHRIECISENAVLRSYDFKYTENVYSHLSELIEKGKDGAQLNSTIFDWGEASPKYQIKECNDLDPANSIMYTGDFNGDGKADIFTIPNRTYGFIYTDRWKLFLGSQTGYTLTSSGYLNSDFKGFIIADADNDGDDDIFFNIYEYVEIECPPGTEGEEGCSAPQNHYTLYSLQNNELVPDPEYDIIQSGDYGILEMYPADFDGNGFTDYIFVSRSDRNIKYINNIPVNTIPNLNSPDLIYLVDFNGDGKTDLLSAKRIQSVNHLYVYSFNSTTNSFELLLNDYNTYFLIAGFGDFNGDGKTDILARNDSVDRQTYIFYSTGSNYLMKNGPISINLNCEPVYSPPYEYFYTKEMNLLVNDFNGDGKSDILVAIISTTYTTYHADEGDYNSTSDSTSEEVYLSNGSGFKFEFINESSGRHSYSQIDNNHDGNADLVVSAKWGDNEVYEFFPENKSQLVSSITDGKNLKTAFTYKSMLDPDVYKRETEVYSQMILPLTYPLKLVSEVNLYDNNNGTLLGQEKFEYANLKRHRQGKGIIGFTKVLSKNLTTGESTLSQYSFDNTYYNTYLADSKSYINENLVSELINTQAFIAFGSRYLPYLLTSTRRDVNNGTSIETTQAFDASGNHAGETLKYYLASTLVKEVASVNNNFNSFGLPGSVSVTNKRGTESITRTKTIIYKPTGLMESVTQSFGASPSLITTYGYDSFGNNTSVSSVSGSKTRQTSTDYEQGKGRFPVKKTDALGKYSEYTWDGAGNRLTSKDITGQQTTYTYDNFGNLRTTILPGSVTITNTLQWSPNSENIGELYFTKTESTGKPEKREYFDILGRKRRTKTQAFDGRWLQTDVEYDATGRMTNSYNPYYAEDSKVRYVHYEYDNLKRLKTETCFPQNSNVTYSYSPLKETITRDGKTYEKIYDASGQLITSTDPGGTIQYVYNAEDNAKQIISPSGTTTIGYDDYGYQRTLQDLDAGTMTYIYNAFGEVESQTDAKGNALTIVYDDLGRMSSKSWAGGETISYTYYPSNELPQNISSSLSGHSIAYTYDGLNRTKTEIETIDGFSYSSEYTYDNNNNVIKKVLNGDVTLDYQYNTIGYLYKVKANNQEVWTANSMDEFGLINDFKLGNNITTTITHDQYGFIDKKETKLGSSFLQNWDYDFDNINGNLLKRKGINSTGSYNEEMFTYDNLDRLKTYTIGANTWTINYDEGGKGNISGKSDIGTFNYSDNATPHKLTGITGITDYSPLYNQSIEYTKFNKISSLTNTKDSENKQLSISYGVDEERTKSVYSLNGNIVKTKIFALGNCEKEIVGSTTRELYYISTPSGLTTILEKINNQINYYYVHTDHLGSIDVITNSSGVQVERLSFDPWGRRRNAEDWTFTNVPTVFLFDRGFTGHEHLDQFGLINMNGRVYDPFLAMFLSPDNYVQASDLTQNFNRYAYCLNNPLIYSDPSGEIFFTILSAIFCPALLPIAIGTDIGWISGGIRGAKTPGMNFWDGAWRGGVTGAIGGALAMVGGAGMSFAANLGLGTAEGAVTGGLNAVFWGDNVGKGMLWGAAGGAILTTFTSENMSNLFKGEGFYTNENVFNNMIGRGVRKQEILDYFGFEGTYNPTAKSPSYVESKGYYGFTRANGEINYGDFAFNSYDDLKITNIKESYHSAKALSGQPFATQDVIPEMDKNLKIYPEERLGFIHAYKNQGLALRSSYNLSSQISFYQTQSFNLDRAKWYLPKWWHFIYKIPRRW